MSEHSPVSLTSGLPETVLPPPPDEWVSSLTTALREPDPMRRDAVASVAARYPRMIEAWANLAELSGDDIESYAYARVGYHRGLDALRAAGWRGSGYVRWSHPTNRGFLRSLEALRQAAGKIGEGDEEERCATFLYQLDPDFRGGTGR